MASRVLRVAAIAAAFCWLFVTMKSQPAVAPITGPISFSIEPLPSSTSARSRLADLCATLSPTETSSLSMRSHIARLLSASPCATHRAASINCLLAAYSHDGFDQETHPGQVLSALAECQVPLDTTLGPGAQIRLADLVDNCAKSFRFDDEIEWRAVALAIYRPSPIRWTTNDGDEVSFDQITRALLQQTRSHNSEAASCWSTHAYYALAMLYQVDRQMPLWKDLSLQDAVVSTLSNASTRLETTLHPDGSWDEYWSLPGISRGVLSTENRLLVTGHHLEWQVVTPAELRASDAVLLSAGEFILRETEKMSVEKRHEKICACSHGLRALLLGRREALAETLQ